MLGFDDLGNASDLVPVTIRAWGGGGCAWFVWGIGYGGHDAQGGGGGYEAATFNMPAGTQLKIRVGRGGVNGAGASWPGGGDGAAPGGGYSGVFLADGTPLVVAGGGGGGTYRISSAGGGAGGGVSGVNGCSDTTAGNQGKGATRTAGGAGGNGANAGGYLQGGNGGGGGGGGGYYGGGGGSGGGYMDNLGCGGGGSGYINTTSAIAIYSSLVGESSGGGRTPGGSNDSLWTTVGCPGYGGDYPPATWARRGADGCVIVTVNGQNYFFGYTGSEQTMTVGIPPNPTPKNGSYAAGLYARKYRGYYPNDENGVFNGAVIGTSVWNKLGYGYYASGEPANYGDDNYSIEYRGYLYSPVSRLTSISFGADDAIKVWVGNGAYDLSSGLTTNGQTDIYINTGYTPIRIRFGESGGNEGWGVSFANWSNPELAYNPATNGY